MRQEELDYDLPPELVAQEPAPRRENARLMGLDRGGGGCLHRRIVDLPALLRPGDLLVLNDTRVLAARLLCRRRTGGRVEVLLVEPGDAGWLALARAGGRLVEGERLAVVGGGAVRLGRALGGGRWVVSGEGAAVEALMERAGRMPLPPYIRREDDDPRAAMDRERYQTVFARAGARARVRTRGREHAGARGAIAAPTAGLHLTEDLLEQLGAGGVVIRFLTLHVGLGTFEPVRTERLEDHPMHEEVYEIPAATADAVRAARREGRRVVAVGTTTVRALEASAVASPDELPVPGLARTRLLILPGYRFRVVDALLTNFHLPRSTLLALVAAFAGRERVLAAYAEAVRRRYRFYSYGDAMLIG